MVITGPVAVPVTPGIQQIGTGSVTVFIHHCLALVLWLGKEKKTSLPPKLAHVSLN